MNTKPKAKAKNPKPAAPAELHVHIHTEAAQAAPETPVAQPPQPQETPRMSTTEITMNDGRKVTFGAKRKLVKSFSISESGAIVGRFDFPNGETVYVTPSPDLLNHLAGHGLLQKVGDNIAGTDDIEDAVEDTRQIAIQLENGTWSQKRESVAGASVGGSMLLKALAEVYTSKTTDQLREFLSTKTAAEKAAMRSAGKVAVVYARLQAEKAARAKPKVSTVDTESLFDELDAA